MKFKDYKNLMFNLRMFDEDPAGAGDGGNDPEGNDGKKDPDGGEKKYNDADVDGISFTLPRFPPFVKATGCASIQVCRKEINQYE